jgi:ATP-binding cassette subfamily C protein
VAVWKADLESVMLLALLFWRALSRVNGIQSEYQELARVESAYWSLVSTIEGAEAAGEVTTGAQEPTLNREISLRSISFSYGEAAVLENVSLTIPVGSFTAVMGASGAGKTTIADLIVGLIRPQSGEVYIDEVPLADLNLRAWRSFIGYVPQETILFHDTIYVNIVLANPELTRDDAEESLRAAGAWEFVSSLPQGMHTVVGERGAKLSGGQRQRIAIARALVRRPKLLILDEVTSALDPETERAICDTLEGLKGRVTIFAISHQQALVDVADNVYFLNPADGEVVSKMPKMRRRTVTAELS